MIGEGAGELGLVGRPVVLGGVVQDEQAERLVAEHDRHVADRPDAGREGSGPDGRGASPAEIAAHDPDLALAHRLHAGGRRVARQGRDDVEHLARQPALGGEAKRRRRAVVGPQARGVHPEQGERLVDDVLEQAGQVLPAADLRGETAQGVGPCRVVRVGHGPRVGDGALVRVDHVSARSSRTIGCAVPVPGGVLMTHRRYGDAPPR